MWALHSSPLLIGTDVRNLSPANLAIYSNPAVIALNQDPSAGAAVLKWRHAVEDVDDNGQGEIQLWTRTMANGDTVMALINAGNSSRMMNATLYDIFLDQATAGTYLPAKELSESWDVYDLWANRMSNEEAGIIINGTAPMVGACSNSTTRYNATMVSYTDGLKANHTALYGTKVGTIGPRGTWSVQLNRHSLGLYRLRLVETNMRKRDEL
jgi:alpha-galactosidase